MYIAIFERLRENEWKNIYKDKINFKDEFISYTAPYYSFVETKNLNLCFNNHGNSFIEVEVFELDIDQYKEFKKITADLYEIKMISLVDGLKAYMMSPKFSAIKTNLECKEHSYFSFKKSKNENNSNKN